MPSQSASPSQKNQKIITTGNFTGAEMTLNSGRNFFQLKDLDFKGIDQLILIVNNTSFATATSSGNITLGSDLLFKGGGNKSIFTNAPWNVADGSARNRIQVFGWSKTVDYSLSGITSPYSSVAFDDYANFTGNNNFVVTPVTTVIPFFPDTCDILFQQNSTAFIDVNYVVYGIFGA